MMDFNTKEEQDVIVLDDEDCPFTIVTVKIGEDGAIEETNEPVIKLAPLMPPANYQQTELAEQAEQAFDSDKTDNSDDWTEDAESPVDDEPVKQKKRRKLVKKRHLKCPHCDRKFTRKCNLNDHLMTHTGEKPFKCSICEKAFILKTNLIKHMAHSHPSEASRSKTQKTVQPFNCWDCKISFTTSYDYKKHLKTHTNTWEEKQSSSFQVDSDSDIAEITYTCAFCDREYPSEESLASHMAYHTGLQSPNSFVFKDDPIEVKPERRKEDSEEESDDESFPCKYCGEPFKTKISLSYHERTHRIKRTFRCPVCKRGFDKRQAYDLHVVEHRKTGESSRQSQESFNCKYCGKQCDSKMTLSYHERTHRIKRKFRCPICRRGFDVKQTYNRHYRSHFSKNAVKTEGQEEHAEGYANQEREKSLNCKYCGKQCATEKNLSYHERAHRNQKNYICSICNKGFYLSKEYYNHMRIHSRPVKAAQKKREKLDKDSSPQSLNCKYCGKYCPTKMNLSYHERSHKIQRTFRCSTCNRGFDSKLKFAKHMSVSCSPEPAPPEPIMKKEKDDESSQSEQSFNCKYCGKDCNTKIRLSYHERTHRIQRNFPCPVCKRSFKNKVAYSLHFRNLCVKPEETQNTEETDKKPFPPAESLTCKYCGKYCKTKVSLSYHERTHKIKRSFRCFVCRRGFDNKQTYDRHIRAHNSAQANPKTFSCKVCGESFNTELSLSNHEEETHRSKWSFCCSVCNKGFNRKQTYDRHIMHCVKREKEDSDEDTPPPSPESFVCKYCGKQCDNKVRLSHHERTHKIKRKPFCCNICGLRLATKAAFGNHWRTHNTDLPYVCSVCNEGFKFPSRLLLHMEKHNQPFSCSVCDSTFSRVEDLNLHMSSIHKTGAVKPFSCKDCGKGFMNKLRLFHHERAHQMKKDSTPQSARYDAKTEPQKVEGRSEEQSFSCNVCGKQFSEQSSFDYHVRRHKVKFPFPCSVCHRRFTKKSKYEEHMREHADESASDQSSDEESQSNTGEIIFSCPHCDRELPTEQALKAHMDNHEKNDSLKPFSCDACGARFEEKQWLESHMEIHNLDRTSMFSCNICNERFVTYAKYEAHMKSHSKRTRFSCTVCNRSFNRRSKLKKHAQLHKEVKPLSRPAGPVALQNVPVDSALKREFPTNNEGEGKWAFTCDECGKQYSSKTGLKYHKSSHLRQFIRKTYHCSVCNIDFKKRLAYEWHVKVDCPKSVVKAERPEGGKEGENWHCHNRTSQRNHCSICNRGFEQTDIYELHMKTLHPQESNETVRLENNA